jgi:hypothetical protein
MQGISFAQQVSIDLGERSYPIFIGSGLLDDPAVYEGAKPGTQALIVTNTLVAPLYAERLAGVLARRHSVVRTQAKQVVRELFSAYEAQRNEMGAEFSQRPDQERALADYIAGMTDRFALREHERLTGRKILA